MLLHLMVLVLMEPIFTPVPILQQHVHDSSFSLPLSLLRHLYFSLFLGEKRSDVEEGGFPDSGKFWEQVPKFPARCQETLSLTGTTATAAAPLFAGT